MWINKGQRSCVLPNSKQGQYNETKAQKTERGSCLWIICILYWTRILWLPGKWRFLQLWVYGIQRHRRRLWHDLWQSYSIFTCKCTRRKVIFAWHRSKVIYDFPFQHWIKWRYNSSRHLHSADTTWHTFSCWYHVFSQQTAAQWTDDKSKLQWPEVQDMNVGVPARLHPSGGWGSSCSGGRESVGRVGRGGGGIPG